MTAMENAQILLVGAGKMGAAMLSGWLANGIDGPDIIVCDPHLSQDVQDLGRSRGVVLADNLSEVAVTPAVIVMAVKPQLMDDVFPPAAALAGPDTVVMSIAAGKPIAVFARELAAGTAIVRAMPNTPAAIGRGITGAVANGHVTAVQKAFCDRLLTAVGEVVWLDDEALIDAVTAVSGSGPAYIFHMVEALAAAGVAAGLDDATAMRLARATVVGSGELLHRSPGLLASVLRQNVTSPGGTTAAALDVLMRPGSGLTALMTEAVAAAKKRGRELG
jgi:pyrroline-5-carboxylate reductase